MSKTDHRLTDAAHESIYKQYILDVRIVTVESSDDGDPRYRFEAPQHRGVEFEDPEMAELYADVYFCTNGFDEEEVGERGIPPVVVGAGRAVLASYLLTQSWTDIHWVGSFFGKKPSRIRNYADGVSTRAKQICDRAEERGMN